MNTLNFETGLKTFVVNGGVEVSFNPTDSFFAERLFAAFEELDKKQEEYKAAVVKMADKREIFDFTRERDREMRVRIDEVFQAEISGAIFGGMNVYALADGLPVWCNFLLAVMDEMDTAFAREQKATNPRIQKYTAKYHR